MLHPLGLDLDFASMDISIREESWDFFMAVYHHWRQVSAEETERMWIKHISEQFGIEPKPVIILIVTKAVVIWILYGEVLILVIRNGSGSYMTAIKNLAALVEGLAVAIAANQPEMIAYFIQKLKEHLSFTSYGDDVAQTFDEILLPSFAGPVLADVFDALGYTATDSSKSATIRDYVSPSDLQFIKRRFVRRDGWVYAPLEEKSLHNSLLFRFRSMNESDFYDACFDSYQRESCHFPDAVTRIKNMASALRSVGHQPKILNVESVRSSWRM